MIRLGVIFVAGLILACGGGDSELPSVEATREAAQEAAGKVREAASDAVEATRGAASDVAEDVEGAMADATGKEAADGQAANCLGLVSEAKFGQAVPICMEALANNPANAEVRDALAKAKAGAANLAAAPGAAADAAAEAAAGAQGAAAGGASDAAKQATGGMLGQ